MMYRIKIHRFNICRGIIYSVAGDIGERDVVTGTGGAVNIETMSPSEKELFNMYVHLYTRIREYRRLLKTRWRRRC